MFYLLFELHFLIHLAPFMQLILVHIFFSFPSSFWFICQFMSKIGRVYMSVYQSVSSFLYNLCAHFQGEKFYFMHIRRERVIGEMHKPKGRRLFFMRKLCFDLCLFSHCYMVLWVMFSIYALLLSSHRVYVLDMHAYLCHCALLVSCSDDHLFCYVIIIAIS